MKSLRKRMILMKRMILKKKTDEKVDSEKTKEKNR